MKNLIAIAIAIVAGWLLWQVMKILFAVFFAALSMIFTLVFIALVSLPVYFLVKGKLLK